MKKIIIVILTFCVLHSNYGQEIGKKYLYVNAAFDDSTGIVNDQDFLNHYLGLSIDNNWLSKNHCLRLVIDTITVTYLETEICIRTSKGNSPCNYTDTITHTRFRGEKEFFDKAEGDTSVFAIDGDAERLFEMDNLNAIIESKVNSIMLTVGYCRGTCDPISNYYNDCISADQKESLRYLLKNKDTHLEAAYKKFRIYFEIEFITKSGKKISDVIMVFL